MNIVSERAENTKITRYFAKHQGNVEKVEVSVQKHFRQLLKDLLDELKFVFDDEDKKWVEASRMVTDISTWAVKIKNRSVQLVWMLESMEFAKTSHVIDRNLRQVPLTDIQTQFRVFLDRLLEETSSLSLKEAQELDSKELIRSFLKKPHLYENIEMVMQAICVGCIKLSVESVAESMISKYNIHNNELRCISEETAQLEMFVAYNGPEIGDSDKLLSEALSEHFKPKGWHFVTNNALYSDEGKTAGRILKQKSRLPFFQ